MIDDDESSRAISLCDGIGLAVCGACAACELRAYGRPSAALSVPPVPKVEAQQPLIGCPPARPQPERLLRLCTEM